MNTEEPTGNKQKSNEQFICQDEVAALLKVTSRTVRNLMRARMIPFYQFGRSVRFRRSEVIEAMARNARIG